MQNNIKIVILGFVPYIFAVAFFAISLPTLLTGGERIGACPYVDFIFSQLIDPNL